MEKERRPGRGTDMIEKKIPFFQLKQIADSGQCFRMTPCADPDDSYTVISGTHFVKVSQTGDTVRFFCSDEEYSFWEQYFDLNTDYGAYFAAVDENDPYLKKAAEFGQGIRILRQDPWEMIITFIISQQKTIPAIRQLVEALSCRYGTRKDGFYAFPTPAQLSAASLEDLLSMKLGYRAKYIRRVCEDACAGRLDLARLSVLPYEEAMEYLTGFYGIGEKVANCICLFGLHHIDAFPVDTWIKKILDREYAPKSHIPAGLPKAHFYDALVKEHFARYCGFAGIMQQYIFYFERSTLKK